MKIDNILNIERAILSSVFYDSILIDELQEVLNFDDFYFKEHQEIFKIMLELYKNNLPIEEEYVRLKLKDKKINENVLIEIIATNAVANVIAYAIEIKEFSKKRKVERLLLQTKKYLIEDKYTSDDVLNILQKEIENISQDTFEKEKSTKEIIEELKLDMLKAKENSSIIGQKSGLKALDAIIGAFEDGDLIVIAARPSMGKTSFISTITNKSLEDGNGVLIESLEMPAKKIMNRLIASRSLESLFDLKKGLVKNLDKFNEALQFFACENLIIHDKTYPTITQLQSRIKRTLRKNQNIKNVIIDHTGKIQLEGKTREDIEIGQITAMLKKIARDFNIRVFLLQQLNRSVESREDKRPMLSDLKNSGNIEEDADVVLGLYRESYYKSKDRDNKKDIENAEIIVLKNRDGQIGIAKVAFEGRCARFLDRQEKDIPVILEYGD